MKHLLITLVAVLTSALPADAQTKVFRHNPQIVNVGIQADSTSVTAVSDTTAAFDTAQTDNDDDYDFEQWAADNGIGNVDDPFSLIAFLAGIGGLAGTFISIFFVLLCIITILLPAIIIGLIFYFIHKNRNKKYKIMEKAVETGAPLPKQLLNDSETSNEIIWRKGIKNAATGVGIIAFGLIMNASFFVGTGFIILFYGAGQTVIARTSADKKHKDIDREEVEDITDEPQ